LVEASDGISSAILAAASSIFLLGSHIDKTLWTQEGKVMKKLLTRSGRWKEVGGWRQEVVRQQQMIQALFVAEPSEGEVEVTTNACLQATTLGDCQFHCV